MAAPGARSGGEVVLVEQASETVGYLDTVPAFELPQDRAGDRRVEVEPAVRALMVVVGDEFAQYTVEVALAANEQPVQALGTCRAHKSFGERVRPRRPNGGLDDPGTSRAQYFVKGPDEVG